MEQRENPLKAGLFVPPEPPGEQKLFPCREGTFQGLGWSLELPGWGFSCPTKPQLPTELRGNSVQKANYTRRYLQPFSGKSWAGEKIKWDFVKKTG